MHLIRAFHNFLVVFTICKKYSKLLHILPVSGKQFVFVLIFWDESVIYFGKTNAMFLYLFSSQFSGR